MFFNATIGQPPARPSIFGGGGHGHYHDAFQPTSRSRYVFDTALYGAKKGLKWGAVGGFVTGGALGALAGLPGGPMGIVTLGGTGAILGALKGSMLGGTIGLGVGTMAGLVS